MVAGRNAARWKKFLESEAALRCYKRYKKTKVAKRLPPARVILGPPGPLPATNIRPRLAPLRTEAAPMRPFPAYFERPRIPLPPADAGYNPTAVLSRAAVTRAIREGRPIPAPLIHEEMTGQILGPISSSPPPTKVKGLVRMPRGEKEEYSEDEELPAAYAKEHIGPLQLGTKSSMMRPGMVPYGVCPPFPRSRSLILRPKTAPEFDKTGKGYGRYCYPIIYRARPRGPHRLMDTIHDERLGDQRRDRYGEYCTADSNYGTTGGDESSR